MPQSLQCPRCNGAVSVADDAAGQRVKCPHCDQTFLAPGFSKAVSDDDDWLSLDEAPLPTSPARAAPPIAQPPAPSKPPAPLSPAPAKPQGRPAPTLSADDQALLSEFTSDLDDFTAEIEKPPPPVSAASASAAPARTTPPGPASPAAKPSKAKRPKGPPAADAKSVEYATEYRVNCNICGSFLYAKAQQAGKTLTCSDCHSPITIPSPPKVRKKTKINIDDAETFALDQGKNVARKEDPYQKSARQLLEDASREEEASPALTYDDTPSVKDWVKNVFGIFMDLGVLVHWVALSVIASIPAVIALSFDSTILILGLFPAGFFLGVLVVSCGFAILHAVANHEDSVSEWPTLDPLAWFGQLFITVAAASIAAVPIWAVCQVVMGTSLIGLAITMISIFIVFPFVLLSMLDMNSVFVPFSPEVARSISKCQEDWGGFYFSSGLLFVVLFLTFAMAASMTPAVGAVVSIVGGIGVTFAYFAMIGRLAYAIGQAVNAPPREDEIDSSSGADAV